MEATIIAAVINGVVTIVAHWFQARHTSNAVAKAALAVADAPTSPSQLVTDLNKGIV